MTDSDPEVPMAIVDILAGESIVDDHIRVQQWIAGDPDRTRRIALIYRMWRQKQTPAYNGGAVAFLDRLHGSLALATPHGKKSSHAFRFPRTITSAVVGVAAAIMLVFAGWQTGLWQGSQRTTQQMSVYSTGNGQRATVVLPDGSTVTLNVASRLEVPADYAFGNRNIRLTGEAIFDVQHHSRHPLSVQAGPSTTRVLGTKFLVRHYPTDRIATIAVRDGKVGVGDVVLTADQQVTVSSQQVSAIQPAELSRFTFASGALTLDVMPLAEAIPMLNRWYDADIRLGTTTLSKQRVKGTFAAGSLSELAEILELAFDVRAVRQGRTLTLYAR